MTTTAPGPGPLRIAIQIPAYSPTLDLSGELLSGEIKVGDLSPTRDFNFVSLCSMLFVLETQISPVFLLSTLIANS